MIFYVLADFVSAAHKKYPRTEVLISLPPKNKMGLTMGPRTFLHKIIAVGFLIILIYYLLEALLCLQFSL